MDHGGDDGKVIDLTGAEVGDDTPSRQPEFDPTGTWVAGYDEDYLYGATSYTRNIVTRQYAHIADDPDSLIWSPDGAKFVARCSANGDYYLDLCIMNTDGSGVKLVKAGTATTYIYPQSWRIF